MQTRWAAYFQPTAGYVQGDTAIRYAVSPEELESH